MSNKNRFQRFFVKAILTLIIAIVIFMVFVWVMAYLLACGEAMGLEIVA